MTQRIFLSTTGRGIARATNTDGDWRVECLVTDEDVRCLAAVPPDANMLYAGTQHNGVLRSDDRGQTWRPAGLSGHAVKSLALSVVEPGVVYAGTMPPLLFVSRDGGTTWRELEGFRNIRSRWWWRSPAEPTLRAYVQAIALSPVNPDLIVAGIEAGAVVRTADGGETWSEHRPGALRDCHTLVPHARSGDWFYEAGGTGAGAAVSRDGGKTWQQPRVGLDRHYGWACAADVARPEVWYVSASPMFSWSKPLVPVAHIDGQANACIYRAAGDGNWEILGGGLPQPLDYMAYSLLTDPTSPGHVYAGLANGDVWHSTNLGDSWQRLPFNLKSIHRALIMV